jgi:DNA repair exonuclease SbcCD nuclease subunit
MAVCLLHTADWQIGRIFAPFEPDDALALFEARFQAVERLAAEATRRDADAVLVAGDVFDAQTVSDKTVRRLFHALEGFAGPWLLLPGNHDAALAESVWTRARRLGAVPPQAVLCQEPGVHIVADRLAVLAAPLVQRHTAGDLTDWFSSAVTPPGLPRVGLAHGGVQGLLPSEADADNPIAPDRAASARLDYLALGDWHGTLRVDDRTWYAGTPETDRFKANASGQALWVQLQAAGQPPQVETLPTGRYRWRALDLTLAVPSDVDETLAQLEQAGPQDVLQLRVAGRCDLAGQRRLQQAVERARARVRALVHEAPALRVEPTPEDLDALQADGVVGAVIEQLRAEQFGPQAETARDALLLLAGFLDDLGLRAAGAAAHRA